ncbi:MMPL family transporter, partial [Streptomyces althioticus]|uniref:MMPL family transporter n=1 Tax=Streptomyces althioticus TaxID=83380 RepID=UPI0036BAC45D
MTSAPRRARWLVPLALLIVWLGVGGMLGPYAGKLGEVATNDQASFLPQSAESTQVLDQRKAFDQQETLPAIVVWTADGDRITGAQTEAATRAVAGLAGTPGVVGQPSPAFPSEDGKALQSVVQVEPDLGDKLADVVDEVRDAAGTVDGTTAEVAGPAASQTDLSDAFSGIDGLLLGVALAAVLVILLLVYRSVLLPFVIILGSVFALGLACAVVYVLADHDVVRVDGQVQGILSILVIGAATDYALLLAARFREELATRGDRFTAARAAVRRSFGAITASAATVALGLLTLLASDLTNNRALGPVGAIGIVCSVLSALTFLPAALALLGRSAYWPAKPKASDATVEGHSVWRRVAATVDRKPRRVWAVTALILAVFAAFSPSLSAKGTPLDEIFVNDAPSVAAQKTLGEHFPGGSGNPAVILADADRLDEVTAAANKTEGVASAAPVSASGRPGGGEPLVVDGRVRLDATQVAAADSDAANRAVVRLR